MDDRNESPWGVLIFLIILLVVLGRGYFVEDEVCERAIREMYSIYDSLAVPEQTVEVKLHDRKKWGSSVSLDAEFATSLSDDEIKDFYMQYFTENGWDYHEKDNRYMKDGLRLVVRKKKEGKYSIGIVKFYNYRLANVKE